MGAKNGNGAFQRMMEDLLGPVRVCADPFVDDIIIGSGTENMTEDELIKAHEKDLRRVLSERDKHNMVCKPTKASLFVKEVEFAGHVVGHGQRRPTPGKLLLFGLCPDVCRTLGAAAQDAAGGEVRWPEGEQEEACLDP